MPFLQTLRGIISSTYAKGDGYCKSDCSQQQAETQIHNLVGKTHLPERLLKKKNSFREGAMPLRTGFKKMVEAALVQCDGNISMAARELKIARSTLYRKIKEFGLS